MTKRTHAAIAIPVSTPIPALRAGVAWRDHAELLLGYADQLSRIGPYVSLAIIYAWFGGMKFTAYEAEGLVPLVQNSPLLSWIYALFSVRGFSTFLGFVEHSLGEVDAGELDIAREQRERKSRADSDLQQLGSWKKIEEFRPELATALKDFPEEEIVNP